MSRTTRGGPGDDAITAWVASASRAELGDLTSSAHFLSAASVSVGSDPVRRVVRVVGDLATGSAAYLDVVLEQETGAARRAVTVDLSGAVFVGVRGIAALVRAAVRAGGEGIALCVVTPLAPDLGRHLRALGLAGMFTLHGSVADCRSLPAAHVIRRDPPVRSRPRATEGHVPPGGAPVAQRPDGLEIVVEAAGRVALARLSGPLSLQTMGPAATTLAELLRENGRVVADLAAVRLESAPALQVFPSTLAASGGWPTTRLVLLDPDRELTATITGLQIDRAVPLAHGLPCALALLDRRPSIMLRYHQLAHDPGAPRRAAALLRSACADWQVEALAPHAAIVAGALVTNALEHARTACRLDLRLDDSALHISVRDRRVADEDTLRRLRSAPVSGGGLRIVGGFARAQGVTPHRDGKTLWASIDRHRRA